MKKISLKNILKKTFKNKKKKPLKKKITKAKKVLKVKKKLIKNNVKIIKSKYKKNVKTSSKYSILLLKLLENLRTRIIMFSYSFLVFHSSLN